jgi:hypothetical protein
MGGSTFRSTFLVGRVGSSSARLLPQRDSQRGSKLATSDALLGCAAIIGGLL